MQTLVWLLAASVLRSWLGSGVVTRLPRRRIQIGMGLALLAAAAVISGRLWFGDPKGTTPQLNLLAAQTVAAQASPNLPNAMAQLASLQTFEEVYAPGLRLEG